MAAANPALTEALLAVSGISGEPTRDDGRTVDVTGRALCGRDGLEGNLVEVACLDCLAEVKVRKQSEFHTSIEWSAEAVSHCTEFAKALGRASGAAAWIVTTAGSRTGRTRPRRGGSGEGR